MHSRNSWIVLVATPKNIADAKEITQGEAKLDLLDSAGGYNNLIIFHSETGDFGAISSTETFAFENGYYDMQGIEDVIALKLLPNSIAKYAFLEQFHSVYRPSELSE